jgi:hypothetical protein
VYRFAKCLKHNEISGSGITLKNAAESTAIAVLKTAFSIIAYQKYG